MAKIYECKQPIELSRKDFERLNKIFEVNFDDETPEMESLINELDARRNTNPCTLWWQFEDGSYIIWDLYIGDENAYDDVRWYENEKSKYPITFDCGFGLWEEIKFDNVGKNQNTYVCKIKIIERCPNCGKAFSLEECDEDPIPMNDLEGNSYTIYYCPDCGAKIYEEKIIKEDK